MASRPLHPRERQILRALAEGLTSKQTATQLSLSEVTVSRMRKDIYLALGAVNGAHAVAVAVRAGLI